VQGNVDFTLPELSSDAAWLQGTLQENYSRGVAANQVAMESDLEAAASASAGGGGEHAVSGREGVVWTETADFLEVGVALPQQVATFAKRDLEVRIEARRVSVRVRNTTAEHICRGEGEQRTEAGPGQMLTLWEGRLAEAVSVDDSTWCVSDHRVELSLEKASGGGLWRKLEE
jgi:hypothetical protein